MSRIATLLLTSSSDRRQLVGDAIGEPHRALQVVDGPEALPALLERAEPDLVVADAELVGELAPMCRHATGRRPLLVALVVEETPAAVRRCLDDGADDYLVLAPERIAARLQVLEQRAARWRKRDELARRLHAGDRLALMGSLVPGLARDLHEACGAATRAFDAVESRLMRAGALRLMEDVREAIQDAQRVLERSGELVRLVSRFAHDVEAEEDAVTIDVNEVIEQAVGVAERFVRDRARVVRSYGTIPRATADRVGLEQVMLNLVLHAAGAVPTGSRRASEVRVHTRATGEAVWVIFTGQGIDATGVALEEDPMWSSTRRLLERYGGNIRADRVGGVGRIVVSVPCAPGTTAVRPLAIQPRVLVIDDEAELVAHVPGILHDHVVTTALNGRDGWDALLRDGPWDAVICSLTAGELSGIQIYERASRRDGRLGERFIFTATEPLPAAARAFLATVPRPVLRKPIDLVELRGLVHAVVWGTA